MATHNQHSTARYCLSWLKRLIEKIIWNDVKFNVFAIRIFGRNVFAYRIHFVMSFLTKNYINLPNSSEDVCVKKISSKNINGFQDYDFELASVKKYLANFPDLCEFFGFFTKNGELAGHIGIMYKGGRDIGVFNVKNIDALIVDVFVSEKYRRRGICIQMLKEVLKYLNTEKNISKAHLIVRLRNNPARAAYRKAGGIEEFQAKTFRILFKIPIHGYDL